MSPIPVIIVTGFLGAGKTTLLNALLRDPAFAETAVLINEFGDVSIDHDLVAEFSDDLITTTTGCMCCSASSDIKKSLFDLWQRRKNREIGPFKRVIVESTGLLDPVPVVHALLAAPCVGLIDHIVSGQFALARVVTLYDVVNGRSTLEAHLEALKQVAIADVVVLTKTDLVDGNASSNEIEIERQSLLAMTPGALMFDRHRNWPDIRAAILAPGTYDLRTKGEDALAWLQAEAHLAQAPDGHAHTDTSRHGDDIRGHCIIIEQPITPWTFHFFLDVLKMSAGPNLLRVKGLFALTDDPDRPVVVHGVQSLIHPIDKLDQWPSEDRRTRLVVIGKNLKIDAMREILNSSKPKQRATSVRLVQAGAAIGVVSFCAAMLWSALAAHPEPAFSSIPQTLSPEHTQGASP